MRVPVYNPQVGIQTSKQSSGLAKEPTVPGVNQASYGLDVAEATQGAGKQLQVSTEQLFTHMQERKALDNKVLKAAATNKADKTILEYMYDETPEEYGDPDPITGAKKTRQAGIMNQYGEAANGAYARAEAITNDVGRRIVATLPPEAQAEWLSEYSTHAMSFHETALKHESTQKRAGKVAELSASLVNLTNSAAGITTQEGLEGALLKAEELTNTQALISNATPDVALKLKDDAQAKVAESAIISNLKKTQGTTADIEKARLQLASIHLPEATNTLLEGKIQTVGKQVRDQAKYQQKQINLDNQADAIIDVATGKDSFTNPSIQLQEKAARDPKGLGAILSGIKKSAESTEKVDANGVARGKPAWARDYAPLDDSSVNIGYAKSIKELASAKTLKELTDYGVDAIIKNPDMTADQKASIAYYIGQKRDKVVQDYYGPLRENIKQNPKQTAEDAGMLAVIRWAEDSTRSDSIKNQAIITYQTALQQKKTPATAYNEAIKTAVILEHPEISIAIEDGVMPNGVVSKSGKANVFLRKNSPVEAHKVWNPKTFKFENNPNRKVASENTKQ